MKRPKISVVMSVYNGETYLFETMESLLNQSFNDFELITVNDGSTDNTLQILKQFKKRDKRVVIVNNKKNIGFTKSLNKGLKIARGKYVARMDADDLCMPERFKIQYDFLEQHKSIFMVGTYAINIDEHGKKLSLFKPPIAHEEIKKTLSEKNCMYHNTIMFRNTRQLFYREKMYYTEDYDFYLNCITKSKKLANIPLFLVLYRRLSDSVSFSKKGKQEFFSKKVREFYFQRLKNGFDDYNSFNPKKYLDLYTTRFHDADILKAEINANFAVNNMLKVRSMTKEYFKRHGHFNSIKILGYYILSYFNVKFVKFIKKIILIMNNKY
ncbi:MAG: glycosyltransferase family 2 protein [Candidatus Woesearchaeota archaeon]